MNGPRNGCAHLSRRHALASTATLLSGSVAGCLGARQRLGLADDGGLSVRWQSDQTTAYDQNHHLFAVTDEANGDKRIVAPHSSLDGGDDCAITAVDAHGASAWQTEINPAVCTPHAVGDIGVGVRNGTTEALAGTEDGTVIGIEVETGDETLRADALDSIGYSAPQVADFPAADHVVAADFAGTIVSLDADGDVAWRYTFDEQTSTKPIVEPSLADGDPALIVAHGTRDDGAVTALDSEGDTRWSTSVGATPNSLRRVDVASDESLFVVGTASSAVAIEPATGETRWTASFDERTAVGDPVDDRVAVGVNDGTVRVLSLADGDIAWSQSIADSEPRLNAPVIGHPFGGDSPMLAATTYAGRVVLLTPTGELEATADHETGIYVSPKFVDLAAEGRDDLLIMDGHGRLVAFEAPETDA